MYRRNIEEETKERSRRNSVNNRDEEANPKTDQRDKNSKPSFLENKNPKNSPRPVKLGNPSTPSTSIPPDKSSPTVIKSPLKMSPIKEKLPFEKRVSSRRMSLDDVERGTASDSSKPIEEASKVLDEATEKLAEAEFAAAFDSNTAATKTQDQFSVESEKLKEKRGRMKRR